MTKEDFDHRQLHVYAHEEARKDIHSWYRLKHGQVMVDMVGIPSMDADEETSSDEGEDMDVNAPRQLLIHQLAHQIASQKREMKPSPLLM